MNPTYSASARALTYPTDSSRVRRVLAMNPASIVRHGQFVTTVGDALFAQRDFLSPPLYHIPARVSFAAVQTGYGRTLHRAMCISLGAVCDLVEVLRPRHSELGVPLGVRTAPGH